ncbi:formimidoylglutamate deiminase [Pararhodobacter zhoushanensis]|uniref:formimidoylglutamate deiminase n=1 Tax=Pararhodobacter zhoushanensis TaxID=2479545 RepID=UPI000F8F0798|nr:formimidoylglutamate deiminase [Pararhodobacter zhoushanensis]
MSRLWAEQALLSTGWARDVAVTLDGPRIARIETGVAPAPGHQRLGALLPAPANLHSHAFQRAMAGMTERRGPSAHDSFWTWRQLMFRFLDQLTPDDVQAITALVQMEMLEAGYGASVEFHYLHHAPGGVAYAERAEMAARIVAAAQQTGIGLTLLPVLYSQGGCDGRALGPGQVRFGNDLDGFARLIEGAEAALRALPGDAVLGIAPHSLRAVTPEQLAGCVQLRPGAPLHMHLAEQIAEVEEVQAFHGARPVEWLLGNAQVDARWCLIHCTQMQRAETVALAATGAVAGLCPITESSLGDGIFDGVAWGQAGGRFGIGSDSNIRITLNEELRVLDHSQRLRDHTRAALATAEHSTGRVLLEGAAQGGAQAAGRDAGALREGALADLLALDTGGVDLEGRAGDALLDAWIFAGDDRAVRDVWSGGRHVVQAGRHVARAEIETGYRAVLRRLKAV